MANPMTHDHKPPSPPTLISIAAALAREGRGAEAKAVRDAGKDIEGSIAAVAALILTCTSRSKDTARLDALENREIIDMIDFHGTTVPYWTVFGPRGCWTTAEGDGKNVSLRDCIDAAIDAAKGRVG